MMPESRPLQGLEGEATRCQEHGLALAGCGRCLEGTRSRRACLGILEAQSGIPGRLSASARAHRLRRHHRGSGHDGNLPSLGVCPFVRDPDGPANLHPTIWRPELLPPTVVLVTAPDCYPRLEKISRRSISARRRRAATASDGGHIVVEDCAESTTALSARGSEQVKSCAVELPFDDDFRVRAHQPIRFQRRLTGRVRRTPAKSMANHPAHRQRLTLTVRALDAQIEGARYRRSPRVCTAPKHSRASLENS